ncbi:ankyrin [Artomyces pyxidatus]|uniref:Ankyrin n=1 Tax=Artomyces pyxidatus TaxID=48021 RepID=A0ACB8TK57_9AGAM|nr:ankyrin [Artomyces pyxidatus]
MAEKDATARLRRAVKENNLFLVKRLIQRTDMRNPDPGPKRYTSLAWAAVLGHEETFEFLLNAGHDDDELSRDSENNTILILLADVKPPSTSPYGPSDPDFVGAALRMARYYFDRYPFILDWSDAYGKTALHVAALKGNEELVRMLCDLGADFDLSDNQGNTPLHYASAWGHIPIVQLLIERGCQFAARNNEGFTPSDYAYSFSTRDTLQDTARAQFEQNKKARRVFAQAAARGIELGGHIVPPKSLDVAGSVRMRSGSATSHTTSTSDSGDLESLPSGNSQKGISPSQRNPYGSGASSSSSTGTFSVPSPSPLPAFSSSSLHPINPASALSPIASRVREQDANAIEKYLRRNRSGSGSTDVKSQNSSNPSSAGPSANGDDIASLPASGPTPKRRLRPSLSAAQLRTNPKPPFIVTTHASQDTSRNRSGTSPATIQAADTPFNSPPSSSTPLPTSSRLPPSRGSSLTTVPVSPETESYVGPSSNYARFPDPPTSENPSPNGTPTVTNTPTSGRRLPFHILSKPLPTIELHNSNSHRRGASIHSMR